MAALLLELNLVRVFDVLWYPNMAYMVITLAVFSFGLSGVYLSLRPAKPGSDIWRALVLLTICLSVCVFLMKPAIDRLPFDYYLLAGDQTKEMTINFMLIYLVICLPFFFSGLVLSMVFSHYAKQIRRLYFWDLIGAAIGCVMLVPLLPEIGTAGVLYVIVALSLVASICFSFNRANWLTLILFLFAIGAISTPFLRDEIDTFTPHMSKRGYKHLVGEINEGIWWDPISKINVLNTEILRQNNKWIAYDGGTQSSYYYRFDGDFDKLRKQLPEQGSRHFWSESVAVSHYLKADSNSRVLIIGAAGGQELKASLTYNPAHVDAIELVGTVVALGKTKYAEYTGNIMNHPKASVQRGEGRSFLRASKEPYDIIQIFSNHTSSSIAAGSGSMQAAYLQTVEAYKEYFSHLNENGILQINHHVYPRMVATASQAWTQTGRTDFRQHVLIAEAAKGQDNLPTFLVKMSPWTDEELKIVKSFIQNRVYPVDPSDPNQSFLSDEFFSGELSSATLDKVPYHVWAPTDDRPFFNSLRKSLDTLEPKDKSAFVNVSVAGLLNSQKTNGFPVDVMHFIVTICAALFFGVVFTLVPLIFSKTGRSKWPGKLQFATYFSCLGLGFIIFELVFIQIYMKVIGYPLYTYTVVVFTFLFGAAIGSAVSERMQIYEKGKLMVPFIGIIISALFTILMQVFAFDLLLEHRTLIRILASIVSIFPLAFFLGMPFPLGILSIRDKPQGTVAWAWGYNGLFTVIGGIFCAVFSIFYGFRMTLIVAIVIYIVAYLSLVKLTYYNATNE